MRARILALLALLGLGFAAAACTASVDAAPDRARTAGQPFTDPALSLLVVPIHGACNFDGVTSTVCDATLSGSTYTLQRDISATTITVATGVSVNTSNWLLAAAGDITCRGTGKLVNNGNAASGATAGAAIASHTFPASFPGGNGTIGAGTGGLPSSTTPLGFSTSTASGGTGSCPACNGSAGNTCQGGGGGGSTVGVAAGGGGGLNTVSSGGSYAWTPIGMLNARTASGTIFTMPAGAGGGAGKTGNSGGGAGGGGGWMTVIARSSNCPMEAKGGDGANAVGAADAGGGGGGPGGIIIARFVRGSLPSANVNGGAGGTKSAGGNTSGTGNGGAGGACISSVCVGLTCRTCIGGTCTTVSP